MKQSTIERKLMWKIYWRYYFSDKKLKGKKLELYKHAEYRLKYETYTPIERQKLTLEAS